MLKAINNLEFSQDRANVQSIEIYKPERAYYEGYIIAIVYSDGGYDMIAEHGLYSYAVGSDGQGHHKYDHSDYCGETPWAEFIEEYIEN